MGDKMPVMSGQELMKILIKKCGFEFVKKSKRNHIKLVKFIDGRKVIATIPDHPELKQATLLGILRQINIEREEFIALLK